MIEVIVTLVVLSVVLGVVTPRLLNLRQDDAERVARQFADALNAVARRSEIGSQPLAIVFDDEGREIEVLSLRRPRGAGREIEPEWAPDPFIAPVELEEARLVRALVAGVVQPPGAWRVDVEPGRTRPGLELAFAPLSRRERDASAWTVSLPAWANRAVVRAPSGRVVSGGAAAAQAAPVDLDEIGAGEARW